MNFNIRALASAIVLGAITGAAAFYLADFLQALAVKRRAGTQITWSDSCGEIIEPKPTRRPWLYMTIAFVLMASVLVCHGASIQAAYVFLELALFLTVAITDIKYRLIPNGVVLGILLVHTTWLFAPYLYGVIPALRLNIRNDAMGMLLCFLAFFGGTVMTGGRVGMGDVKLAMAVGFMLGWQKALLTIALSGVLMIPFVFTQPGMNLKVRFKQMIPFGPPFSLAAMLVLTASFTPLALYMQY